MSDRPLTYITVAKVEEVLPGQSRPIQLGQCSILLINEAGSFYALQGVCPHQDLPLADGKIWKGVLDCPWHHFQYDIRTGENLYPRRVYPLRTLPHLCDQVRSLQTYPVQIVGQEVQVGISECCLECFAK
ncbi:MAG: Rieske 2Fe-2S domain-containing protein [Leptolyngbyaceae cyanobacterium SM1_4_3]|nr:Rieske 2Fe-2S domain-containing protein [Leptolyngbyaceae cyanobacterium SM1_4_3]NJN89301.1 Rieske 2Fe-2S domain-containing protein [Leptolyngbyaceae cyanobacterium SL_5_14]NJO66673.1 Rieske 2Fe-2S domain-containing protein [Leptolyngbyaceae cyanobacterium RM1_405_57]